MNVLGTVAIYGTPYLFVTAALRIIERHGISTTKNRTHPWKVPPAELVILAAAVIGWIAILALAGVYAHLTGLEGPGLGSFNAGYAPATTGTLA